MNDLANPFAGTREGFSGNHGALAQLGEHLLCKQGVVGSIPTGSTKLGHGKTADV